LIIDSEAPGCRFLKQEIRLIAGLDRIEMINTLNKERIYDPEGVHIAFPFHIPEGVMRMDGAWGIFRPEDDQIPGSCKNYFAPHRWVDVSNANFGVTWTSLDAPMTEVGAIRCDPTVYGWIQHLEPSQTLFSYVMNNYWETNYCAAQEGEVIFRYTVQLHGAFHPTRSIRFGMERNQPLIAVPAGDMSADPQSLFELEAGLTVVTSLRVSEDKNALMIRLFNTGDVCERVSFNWNKIRPRAVYRSSPYEEKGEMITDLFEMSPFEVCTLRAE
jgi:hypothetical protein